MLLAHTIQPGRPAAPARGYAAPAAPNLPKTRTFLAANPGAGLSHPEALQCL
jgi:hypothetical protein